MVTGTSRIVEEAGTPGRPRDRAGSGWVARPGAPRRGPVHVRRHARLDGVPQRLEDPNRRRARCRTTPGAERLRLVVERADEEVGQVRELLALDVRRVITLESLLVTSGSHPARRTRRGGASRARRTGRELAEHLDAGLVTHDLGREEVRSAWRRTAGKADGGVRRPPSVMPSNDIGRRERPPFALVALGIDGHAEVRAAHRVITYRAALGNWQSGGCSAGPSKGVPVMPHRKKPEKSGL